AGGDRQESHDYGDPSAPDDLAEHVSAQRVGSEQMLGARAREHVTRVVQQGIVGGKLPPEGSAQERQTDEEHPGADLGAWLTDTAPVDRRPRTRSRLGSWW